MHALGRGVCWFESSMRTVEEAGAGKLSQLLAASECDGAGVRVLVHLLSEEHHLSWVDAVGRRR